MTAYISLQRLSQTILTHMGDGTMPTAVELDVDPEGSFTFRFSDQETEHH